MKITEQGVMSEVIVAEDISSMPEVEEKECLSPRVARYDGGCRYDDGCVFG